MNTVQENVFDTLFTDLSRTLRPLAWRYSQAFVDLDMDDFLSIGLAGVAQVYRATGTTDHAFMYGVARNKMRDAFCTRRLKDIPSFSLDNYLYDAEADRERYIAEDLTVTTRESSAAVKDRVAEVLATLPEKHRQLLRARYQVEDADGTIPTVESVRSQYHLSSSNFIDTCNRAALMALRNAVRQGVTL